MARYDFSEENSNPVLLDDFYKEAFGGSVSTLWGEVFPKEVGDLCYRMLLGAFKDNSRVAVADRRRALYSLLTGTFNTKKAESPINSMSRLLPARNWVAKVTNSVCTAYNSYPSRIFATSEIVERVMRRLYKVAGADVALRYAYEQATLQNVALVRPYVDYYRRMRFSVITSDVARVKYSKADGEEGRMLEVWIAIANPSEVSDRRKRKEVEAFQVWRDDKVEYVSAKGDTIRSAPNRYGKIPFVLMQIDQVRSGLDSFGDGQYGLAVANLVDNAIYFSTLNSAFYNSFSVWVSTNLNWGKDKGLFPGKLVTIENAKAGNDIDPRLPPSIDAISSDGQYTMLNELRESLKEEELFNLDVPDFLATRKANLPTTATEQILRYGGLLERRKQDLPMLESFELDLAQMVGLVARVDLKETGLDKEFVDFTIDFPELPIIQDPEKELAYKAKLVASGIMRLETFVTEYSGADNLLSLEDAVAWIQKRSEAVAPYMPAIEKLYGLQK